MSENEEKAAVPRQRWGLRVAGATALLLLLAALYRAVGPSGSDLPPLEGAASLARSERDGEREFFARMRAAQPYEMDGKYLLGPEFLDIFNAFRVEYIERGKDFLFRAFGQWARESYSPEVARLLVEVFRNYIRYLERLSEPGLFPGGASMGQKYQIILALRREIFGEEIASLLFKYENERIELAMMLEALRTDPTLSEEEKKQKAKELEDSLDPATRERLFPYDPHKDYRERLSKLEEEAADLPAAERARRVRELRVEMFGEEAAGRLEDLDQVRAERAARESVYEDERARILADPALSAEEKAEQVRLLQEDVLRPEQIRQARALETLEGLTPEQVAKQIRAIQEGEAPAPDWDTPEQRGENVDVPEEALNPPK